VTSPPPWTLRIGPYPPVPVTPDRTDGVTTRYRTALPLPIGPPGKRTKHPATLTAPDGSEEVGVGSVDGIVLHTDRTKSTTVSFTPYVSPARRPLARPTAQVAGKIGGARAELYPEPRLAAPGSHRLHARWCPCHATAPPPQRGYGPEYQAAARKLKATMRDGAPCCRCSQPMYRRQLTLDRNDIRGIDADHHAQARALGGQLADTLAHRRCNRSAGAPLGNRLSGRTRRVTRPPLPQW
jgi:hypothetical protein